MRLADGRALSWYQFGDPAGVPCLYLPGTPSSGLAGDIYDREARAAGVRLISIDRPGYGGSDFIRRRCLTDTTQDVHELLRHLDVRRCAIFGESGGAAFALAVAHDRPDVITTVALVASIGPTSDHDRLRMMKRSNRALIATARRTPWLLRPVFARQLSLLTNPRRVEGAVKQMIAAASSADQHVYLDNAELLSLAVDATVDALRVGSRGAATEMALLARPWGFLLQHVQAPVVMWHGAEDTNVPVAVAENVAAALPNCRLRIVDGGHAIGPGQAAEVMRLVSQRRPRRFDAAPAQKT